MNHDHSMFFIIVCLYIIIQLWWERFRKARGLFGKKNSVEFFIRMFIVLSVG